MGTVLETLTALVCVLGLTGLCWWLLGRLLRPLPCRDTFILLRTAGEGTELEQTIRGFLWLRSLGVVKSTILIADLGLNARGREVALRLCARWPGVVLWPAGELSDYLEQT